MAKTFAFVSGILLITLAFIELFFFRGSTAHGLPVFSIPHNLIHWLLGAAGLLTSWAHERMSILYARLVGVFLVMLAIAGLFFPGVIAASSGIQLNAFYNLWHLGLGFWGVAAGFRKVQRV